MLSDALGEASQLTLIDKNDSFVFGFSKLDVMFGRDDRPTVRLPYAEMVKPGVRFLRETVTAIDPQARTRDDRRRDARGRRAGDRARRRLRHATRRPGCAEAGNEFYSVAGADGWPTILPQFTSGRAVIGVCGAPFKCPPAPSETALLAARLPDRARPARRLRDLLRDPAAAAPCRRRRRPREALDAGVRRARHRLHARRAACAALDGERGSAHAATTASEMPLRPVPRRAQAPRAGRR